MVLPKDRVWQDYMVNKLACMCRWSCWQGKRPGRDKDTVKHQCTGPQLLHRSSPAQKDQDSWGGAGLLHNSHQYSHTPPWVPCPDPLRGFHAGQLRHEKGSLDISMPHSQVPKEDIYFMPSCLSVLLPSFFKLCIFGSLL